MKTPYISNYIEEHTLETEPTLFYDNITQVTYIDELKSKKALRFGPDTTIATETVENSDCDETFFGPDTTLETATVENRDQDEYLFGPDTTTHTFTSENQDKDEIYLGPDTTRFTKTIENSDPDEVWPV